MLEFLQQRCLIGLLLLTLVFTGVRADDDDEDGNVGLAFGLVFAAGFSTTFGAAAVFYNGLITQENKKFLGAALGFSSGVMIYIALVEILQESFGEFAACNCLWDAEDEVINATTEVPAGGDTRHGGGGDDEEEEESSAALLMGTFMFFVGVGIIYGLDELVHYIYDREGAPLHSHLPSHMSGNVAKSLPPGSENLPNQIDRASRGKSAELQAKSGVDEERAVSGTANPMAANGDDLEGELEVDDEFYQKELQKMGILTAIALGLHNFPEGLATLIGTLEDPAVGAALAFAIAVHNIPEGLCVAIPIYYATGSRWKGFWIAVWSGFCEVVGAAVGYAFLREYIGPASFAILFGIVAGMMTTICFKELIPTALRYDPEDKYVTNCIFVGAGVMAFSIILFEI